MTNPNEPAFPSESEADNSLASALAYRGLTKREYFAALAMQGIFASYANPEINTQLINLSQHARQSIQMADALILELNKSQGDK